MSTAEINQIYKKKKKQLRTTKTTIYNTKLKNVKIAYHQELNMGKKTNSVGHTQLTDNKFPEKTFSNVQ